MGATIYGVMSGLIVDLHGGTDWTAIAGIVATASVAILGYMAGALSDTRRFDHECAIHASTDLRAQLYDVQEGLERLSEACYATQVKTIQYGGKREEVGPSLQGAENAYQRARERNARLSMQPHATSEVVAKARDASEAMLDGIKKVRAGVWADNLRRSTGGVPSQQLIEIVTLGELGLSQVPEHLNRGIDLTREYEALAREALGKLLGPPTHRRRVRPPGRLRLRLPARLRSILGPNAGADAAKNAEAVPSRGFLDTIEVRFPVDPRHALLMTWRGDEDTSVCGSFAQACNMNASISRQADKEWFFKPGAVAHRLNPATLQRDVVPISTELFPEYTSAAALRSRRRLETERVAAQIIQEDPPPDRMPFVNTRRRRGSGTA